MDNDEGRGRQRLGRQAAFAYQYPPPLTLPPSRDPSRSQTSLDSPSYGPGELDDQLRLTASNYNNYNNGYHYDYGNNSSTNLGLQDMSDRDPEMAESQRQRITRYDDVGGLAHNRTLKAMSRNLRRASMRVVNLANLGLDDQPVRLEGEDDPLPDLQRLRGRTLMMFGPKNPLRVALHKALLWRWTEPIILLLIFANAIILALQSHLAVETSVNPPGYFQQWEDWAIFALFVLFTFESLARIIVSGLILDPETKASSWRLSLNDIPKWFTLAPPPIPSPQPPSTPFEKPSQPPASASMPNPTPPQLGLNPSAPSLVSQKSTSSSTPFAVAIAKQRSLAEQSRPYLRHSWNRIDFLAVCSFWVMFILATLGIEKTSTLHISIFRALSVLRTTRLLAVTHGTTTIMRSLKTAAPLLANVALFLLFAIVLFSIVGVQSFKGSFRRQCVLQIPGQPDVPLGQLCGGFVDPITLKNSPYIDSSGRPTTSSEPKGFICPLQQTCIELSTSPKENVESFDDVFRAALQILIITGANQWSSVMYAMMDADFSSASLFFIGCLMVLNFWLLNIFVAVITNTFAVIRTRGGKSAFGATEPTPVLDEQDAEKSKLRVRATSWNKEWYQRSQPLWIVLAFFSLLVQALVPDDGAARLTKHADLIELAITLLFDLDILWRFTTYLPAYRQFGLRSNNWLDLFLAVSTTIIQIPLIKRSPAYPWLTILQLIRFYRVVLAIPRMRPLLLAVFGNTIGLANMTLFLFLINFLAALVALQIFRGDIPDDTNMNFGQLWNGFLGMYQVFSSENWTDILYNAVAGETPYRQQVITILFITGWFFFANFIMLQMFIAVINENFEVAEEQKRAQQVQAYIRKSEPVSVRTNWIDRINPYRWLRAKPTAVEVSALPSNLVLPMKKSVVQDYRGGGVGGSNPNPTFGMTDSPYVQGWLGTGRRLVGIDKKPEHVPLTHLKARRESTMGGEFQDPDDHERQLDMLAAAGQDNTVQDTNDALFEQRARKKDFIEAHPSYDRALWILSHGNPIRHWCQLLVPPSNGERIFGASPSPIAEFIFRAIMILTVIAGIVVAAVATPVYRKQFYEAAGGPFRGAWFDIVETTFGFVLVVEFLIKIFADGFLFTPNGYLLSIWNVVDFAILLLMLINMITTLIFIGGLSRGTRAIKAFRALRLITLFGTMRETFHSVLIAGAARILDAAMLALLYMIPYAVWGLNIFRGALFSCNDAKVSGKATCLNEYQSAPVDPSFPFLAPRVWDNPSTGSVFSFDSFGASLLILFEIVSLEGWIDVMNAAMGITAKDQQPQPNSSPGNAVFFLIYNLLGAVVILTLFVSIIISNFSSRSGMALLATEQRQWIDLRKFLVRQKPSKLPKVRPTDGLRSWCFDRSVQKHGWWSRSMTVLYAIHIIVLMTQTFDNTTSTETFRDLFFLGVATIYMADIFIRFLGLGQRTFWSSGWHRFDVFVVLGTFATTIPIMSGSSGFLIRQLQKLFLVSIAFKLVQKTNNLNQLFKTAASSVSVILNLFLLWVTLFLFFAILFIEVFSLTKWGHAETHTQNYASMGNALVMLAFMCTGEGWNGYMHDFTTVYPRCTDASADDLESDCGSLGWAFVLFIAWNVLSMYIFVNMFTGVVVENFSYVIQQKGTSSVTREEMRAFKKVWAEFDKDRNGYITPDKYTAFFSKLTGVFEVRIYSSEFAVPAMQEAAKRTESDFNPGYVVDGIVISRLEKILSTFDPVTVRARRRTYNRLYQEARIIGHGERGLSFTQMLLLLAHHKLIDDDQALKVDELLKRKVITDEVEAAANLSKVKSLLRMIYHRRRLPKLLEEQQRELRGEPADIPAIFVADDYNAIDPFHSIDDYMASTPTTPIRSRDITLANRDSNLTEPDSPLPRPNATFAQPPPSPRRGRQRVSNVSMLSGDALQSRDVSPNRETFYEDPQNIISSINGSMWGDMMQEAARDEDE